MTKIWATLACRNNGSRLYGKPLQNLDTLNNISILDNILGSLKSLKFLDGIILAISEGADNDIFEEYAQLNSVKFIRGDEHDVLGRILLASKYVGATDVLRVTTESPFLFTDAIDVALQQHLPGQYDATFLDRIIDGCGFEIISTSALERSHEQGEDKHRSELCSLYIRENKPSFKINYLNCPVELIRSDIRLTVDNPEDLIICREVFAKFNYHAPNLNLFEVVKFLDENPHLIKLTIKYCHEGMKTMYL